MKVNYTLPGLFPESRIESGQEPGITAPEESFGSQLQRLRVPEITDWKQVLRLGMPSDGLTALAPPPAPYGLDPRDPASQRAWWRGMLQKHLAASVPKQATNDPVANMLGSLLDAQRREDEVFARHFTESEN